MITRIWCVYLLAIRVVKGQDLELAVSLQWPEDVPHLAIYFGSQCLLGEAP